MQTTQIVIFIFGLFLIASIFLFSIYSNRKHRVAGAGATATTTGEKHQCGKSSHTCGAIDPVSEPSYNMKQIAKQSILLEEHLIEKKKRCKDCIAKHFLHIIGLAEEAKCLAGSSMDSYKFLKDSPDFYTKLFNLWLENKDNEEMYPKIEDSLRKKRKEIIEVYILE